MHSWHVLLGSWVNGVRWCLSGWNVVFGRWIKQQCYMSTLCCWVLLNIACRSIICLVSWVSPGHMVVSDSGDIAVCMRGLLDWSVNSECCSKHAGSVYVVLYIGASTPSINGIGILAGCRSYWGCWWRRSSSLGRYLACYCASSTPRSFRSTEEHCNFASQHQGAHWQ